MRAAFFKSFITGALAVCRLFVINHHAELCYLSAQIHTILTDGCFQSQVNINPQTQPSFWFQGEPGEAQWLWFEFTLCSNLMQKRSLQELGAKEQAS